MLLYQYQAVTWLQQVQPLNINIKSRVIKLYQSGKSALQPHLDVVDRGKTRRAVSLSRYLWTKMFLFTLSFPFLSQLGLFPSSHGGEPTLPPPHSWSVTGSEAHGWTGREAAAHLLPQIYSTGKKHFFEAYALQEITRWVITLLVNRAQIRTQ